MSVPPEAPEPAAGAPAETPPRGSERGRWLALLLIALGLVWLLAAVGFVPPRLVGALLWLWPLLLIGVGVDLLTRRRVLLGLPYTGVALALLLLAALLFPRPGAGAPLEGRRLSAAIGTAERAEITLDLASAPVQVTALTPADALPDAVADGDPAPLIIADVRDTRRVALRAEGGRTKEVRLGTVGGPRWWSRPAALPPGERRAWNVGLSPALPLELEIDGGSGTARMELAELDVTSLRADLGSGAVRATLPRGGAERAVVTLDGGSGALALSTPDDARLEMELATGSGATELRVGRRADLLLRLDLGSGSVTLDLPDDAPVRFEATDDGSGALLLPRWLERVSGSGERGVWRSANYREGVSPAVVVLLEDAGSGALRVR